MASISTNSKKQIVLQWYYRSQKFQVAFRDPVEAEQLKAQVETEVAKYKATGKESVFLNSYYDAKKSKEKTGNKNPQKISTNALIDLYKQELELNWAPTTKRNKQYVFECIKELLKNHKTIDSVTKKDFISFTASLQKQYKSSTAKNRLSEMVSFFSWCFDNKYISEIPWGYRKPPTIKNAQQVRKQFLYLDEVNTFLEAAKEKNHYYLYCAIGIYAGLRDGEIQRLKWCDIYNAEKVLGNEGKAFQIIYSSLPRFTSSKDFEKAIEELKEDPKRLAEYFFKEYNKTPKQLSEYNSKIMVQNTKNKKIRDVPLTANLLRILQEAYLRRSKELIQLEIDPKDVLNVLLQEYIVWPEKTAYNPIRHRFGGFNIVTYVCETNNLNFSRNGVSFQITPHILRYTFASLLLNAGEAPDNVRRYLGHSSQTMTDHYAYLMVETKRISF